MIGAIQNNYYIQNSQKKKKAQTFNGGFTDLVTSGIKKIETGGVLVDFLFVDMLGMVIPRTYQAFTRNREELDGKLNVKNGVEELIREIFSGPSMFVIPMVFGLLSKKIFGKASQIQFKVLDSLTDSFGRVVKNTAHSTKDKAKLKDEFYRNVFAETFEKHKEVKLDKPINIDKHIEKLVGHITNIEKGEKAKENTQEIIKIVSDINKSHGLQIENSHNLTLKNGLTKDVGSLIDDMVNYSKDVVEKVADQTNKDKFSFLAKLHHSKIKGRRINTISTFLATSAFLYSIPIMYKQNEQFPGIDGLVKQENTPQPQSSSSTEKKKETKSLAFGKNSTPRDRYFDFNGHNVPYPILAFYTLGLMLGCRWIQARNSDERREVATRDFSGLTTIVFAVPVLRNITSTLMKKSSGIPISKSIKGVKAHLNPNNKPFSFDNIKDIYAGVSKYKNGIVDFAQNIDNHGGDLRKVFNFLSDDSKKVLNETAQELYPSNTVVKSGNNLFARSFKAGKSELKFPETNKKIIELLKKAANNDKSKSKLDVVIKELDKDENPLVKFAEAQKSIPEAVSIVAISGFLGWFLPWFNIHYTKNLYKNKNKNSHNDEFQKQSQVKNERKEIKK